MRNIFDLHDQREMNKMSLETFHFDKENHFERAADGLISNLLIQNNKLDIDLTNATKTRDDIDQLNIMTEIYYNNEELMALEEMKVLYAFKHLEINMKVLLRAAYPGIDSREFFRWDKIVSFLKTKNIHADKLECYKEADELRKVNNAIKHSSEPGSELNKVPEFLSRTSFQYRDLQIFYNRVKTAPNIFLASLGWSIYKDLYEFNDQKIETMANELVLRMQKKDAEVLMEQVLSKYNFSRDSDEG